MKLTKIALAVAAVSISSSIVAQTERDLGSHEHGAALLNIAIESNSVVIELETPWNNIVGFEHAPSTDDQKALVEDALAKLNQPADLFKFQSSECSVAEVMVESTLEDEHHDDHDDEHTEGHDDHDDDHKDGHDDHDDDHAEGHDDDHDDDHKDGHDDDHDDEHKDGHDDHDDDHAEGHDDHEGEETHSEVLATYSFDCNGQATGIDVKVFEIWSGFEELDVQMIGPGGTGSAEISASQSLLDVSGVLSN